MMNKHIKLDLFYLLELDYIFFYLFLSLGWSGFLLGIISKEGRNHGESWMEVKVKDDLV